MDAVYTRCQVFSLDTEQEPNRRMYNQLRVQERAQTNFVLSRRGARERHGRPYKAVARLDMHTSSSEIHLQTCFPSQIETNLARRPSPARLQPYKI